MKEISHECLHFWAKNIRFYPSDNRGLQCLFCAVSCVVGGATFFDTSHLRVKLQNETITYRDFEQTTDYCNIVLHTL